MSTIKIIRQHDAEEIHRLRQLAHDYRRLSKRKSGAINFADYRRARRLEAQAMQIEQELRTELAWHRDHAAIPPSVGVCLADLRESGAAGDLRGIVAALRALFGALMRSARS